jgi:hypothetical protein
VELTVIPEFANEITAPDWNPDPLIVMFCPLVPRPRELGLAPVTVGAVVVTEKTPVPVPEPPSVFVTVTFRAPVTAVVAMVTLAVSCVELTNDVELTVIPVPEKDTLAPLAKPVPVIVTFWLVAPCASAFGLAEPTVGAASTVKIPWPVPAPASGLVTVTFRLPVAAVAAMVTLAVSCVELTNDVELTVIPVPEKDTLAPLAKPVPVIVTFWLVAP